MTQTQRPMVQQTTCKVQTTHTHSSFLTVHRWNDFTTIDDNIINIAATISSTEGSYTMTFSSWKRLLLLQTLCVLTLCILLILHQAPSPVHSFGNFVLPKHIFGTNSFFTNPTTTTPTTSTVVRTKIEAKVRIWFILY